jgi:hypothetical protein
MNPQPDRWFALGAEGEAALRCAACGTRIHLEAPSLDHHPRVCPACGAECIFVSLKGRLAQVVLAKAPPALAEVIRFAQQRLDELDFVELLVALEELADAVCTSKVIGE